MLRLDCTTVSVVIVCTECPWWHAIRLTKLDAWECAANHERQVHPDDLQARNAYYKHLERARTPATTRR